MNILAEIQSKFDMFSEKEQLIGKWLLQKDNNINNMMISTLSEKIGVSNSTITRFCKKLECESFADLKIKLNSCYNMQDTKEDKDDLFSSVHEYYQESINRTRELIDKETMLKLVDEIKKAKRIFIYGVGSSGFTSLEMMQRLVRMGISVNAITDSHMMIINSSIVTKGDLVIGISISGKTKEINNALKLSQKRGAIVASFTSLKSSEINQYSDLVFQVCNTEYLQKERFINTQFSTMYILDMISMLLLKDDEFNGKMKLTLDAIINAE